MLCDFSVLIKYLARSNFLSMICMTHLDLRNPFGVSERTTELLLNSVLTNAESRGISLFYACRVPGSVMFVSMEGNKR